MKKELKLQQMKKDALENLCYYDLRNPNCSLDSNDNESIKKYYQIRWEGKCECDNCFDNRTPMAETILALIDDLETPSDDWKDKARETIDIYLSEAIHPKRMYDSNIDDFIDSHWQNLLSDKENIANFKKMFNC